MPTSGRAQPKRAVTGRALVLGVVVVLLMVLLASPLNRYFASRGDVARAAAQLTHDRAQLAQLQQEQKDWGDPGYIQQQARERLQYAMPGDTVYHVVDNGAKNQLQKTAVAAGPSTPTGSWNSKLWDSVSRASGTS